MFKLESVRLQRKVKGTFCVKYYLNRLQTMNQGEESWVHKNWRGVVETRVKLKDVKSTYEKMSKKIIDVANTVCFISRVQYPRKD